MTAKDGRPTVCVYENYACKLPATDVKAFRDLNDLPGDAVHPNSLPLWAGTVTRYRMSRELKYRVDKKQTRAT